MVVGLDYLKILIIKNVLAPPAGLILEDNLLAKTMYPTLAIWRHTRSVIIGRTTNTNLEVDCDTARRLNIPVYRRLSGGGAVYHDEGNLNFSLIIHKRLYPRDLYSLGHKILLGILSELGIHASIENEGDIAVNGWKISGSAARIGSSKSLFHATLLVEADTSILSMVTKPRMDLVRSGRVSIVKYRPRNLSSMYPSINLPRVYDAIRNLATSRGWPLITEEAYGLYYTDGYRRIC